MPLHLALHATDDGLPNQVRIKLKLAYGLHGRRPRPTELVGKAIFEQTDFRSDFWPRKPAVDVVVLGHAYARGLARACTAEIRIADITRSLHILGDRRAQLVGGAVQVSDPLPFDRMPVTRERAYGGTDSFYTTSQEDIEAHGVSIAFDHPGMYPRNPHGRGYALTAERLELGVALPNVEWLGQEIAKDAWWVRSADAWPHASPPACIDFMPPQAYPRRACFGDPGAWAPFDETAVRDEERARIGTRSVLGISQGVAQEAWPGMTLAKIQSGEPVAIDGMHPEHKRFAFELPTLPEIEVTEKGVEAETQVRAETLVIEPEAERYTIVFGAEANLRKRYIPYAANVGDIGVRINGGPVVRIPIEPGPIGQGAHV